MPKEQIGAGRMRVQPEDRERGSGLQIKWEKKPMAQWGFGKVPGKIHRDIWKNATIGTLKSKQIQHIKENTQEREKIVQGKKHTTLLMLQLF